MNKNKKSNEDNIKIKTNWTKTKQKCKAHLMLVSVPHITSSKCLLNPIGQNHRQAGLAVDEPLFQGRGRELPDTTWSKMDVCRVWPTAWRTQGDGWLPTEEGKLYCLFVLETRKLATPRLMKLIWHWGNADGWFPLHRCCAKVLWKFNMLWLQSCRQDRHPGERQEWWLNTNTRTHTHTQTRTHRRKHERAHA